MMERLNPLANMRQTSYNVQNLCKGKLQIQNKIKNTKLS